MEFKVGDTVLLTLGIDEKYAPKGLQRWNGCSFVISKVHGNINPHYYELRACKSPSGVPYAIEEDWLTKTR